MRLILVRHGQTFANVAGELDTAPPGAGLTPLGLRQAEALPAALADDELAVIYTSTLDRTRMTAGPLARARGLEVVARPGLEEVRAGDFELRSDHEAVEGYLSCLAAWMLGDLARAMPGAGDGHAFLERYDAAVRAIASEHTSRDTVVVISHGAAIRTWSALRAAGLDAEDVSRRRIHNTGGVILEGNAATGWTLARWSGDPLGGADLDDRAAHDVTGDSTDEALAEAE